MKKLSICIRKRKTAKGGIFTTAKKMVKLPAVQKLCQQHSCQNRQFAMRYPVSIVLKKILARKSFKMEFKNVQNDTFRA